MASDTIPRVWTGFQSLNGKAVPQAVQPWTGLIWISFDAGSRENLLKRFLNRIVCKPSSAPVRNKNMVITETKLPSMFQIAV